MARSKAKQVRAKPGTVTLEGVDPDGNETEVTWKIHALDGDTLLEVDEMDEDEDSLEIIEHMLYHTLVQDDPEVEREEVMDMDWPFLMEILEKIGEVNGMEDFFDEEAIKKELQNRQSTK